MSVARPTWLKIDQNLTDPELVLQAEVQEDDDFVPRDGFQLGGPLESAINLYKDVQEYHHQSVSLHPYHKVLGLLSTTKLLWSQLALDVGFILSGWVGLYQIGIKVISFYALFYWNHPTNFDCFFAPTCTCM